MKLLVRSLIALLTAALWFCWSGVDTSGAEQNASLDYSQSVTALYGTKLTFSLEATATTSIGSPELVVIIDHRPGEFRKQVTDAAPALSLRVSQAVSVDDLGLPPYSVLRYWWEVIQDDGQRISTEPVLMLYEDTAVPWVWQTSQQGNVVVHARDSHASEASQALAAANEAQRALALLVGARTEEPLHIYIYPELAQLAGALRLHGIQVNDWVAAYALSEQRVSLIALEDGPSRDQALQEDVSHEIAHLVIDIAAGDAVDRVPAWFSEGAALSLAAEPDSMLTSVLDNAEPTARSQFRNGAALCQANFGSLSPHEASLAYAHSAEIFSYVGDRYGSSQLQGFLTAYQQGVGCLEAFDLVLGSSYQNIYDQWQGDLVRAPSRGTEEGNDLGTWILGWGVSLFVALLFLAPFPTVRADPAADAYSTKLRLSQIDEP